MSQTVSPSTSRSYALARVARAWSVSRAGVYRFLEGTPSPAIARRPGPTGPCRDADLADHIRREIEASDFHGEGYRKIWARLRVAGVCSSPGSVRRVRGENGLLAPHRVGRNQEKAHDGTIVTDKVNEMWGMDMSQTVTFKEGRAYVFVAVEHAKLRNRRHSRRAFSQSLRGARAPPPGGASAPSRPAWRDGSSCVTIKIADPTLAATLPLAASASAVGCLKTVPHYSARRSPDMLPILAWVRRRGD